MKFLAFDLDRVLFDTDAFSTDLGEISHELCNVSLDQFTADKARFRIVGKQGLRHYDFAAQVASYGASAVELYPRVLQRLGEFTNKYVYPDVSQVLQVCDADCDNVFILTYGDDMYQRLKLEVSPTLHDLKSRIVLEPKGEFINSTLPGSQGVLFDDTVQEWLPAGWEHILVERVQYPHDALERTVMNYKHK